MTSSSNRVLLILSAIFLIVGWLPTEVHATTPEACSAIMTPCQGVKCACIGYSYPGYCTGMDVYSCVQVTSTAPCVMEVEGECKCPSYWKSAFRVISHQCPDETH